MRFIIALIIGFFFGSIPWGYIIVKLFRRADIREYGSKNIGATNVWRVYGKFLGILVFLLDAAMGFIPVFWARTTFGITPAIFAGIGALLGRAFTPWLGWRGGKGVSTGLGIFIGLTPVGAAIAFGAWLVLLLTLGWVSVASMGAALVLVIVILIMFSLTPIFFFMLAVFLLVVFLHRKNIRRLIRGEEPKIRKK